MSNKRTLLCHRRQCIDSVHVVQAYFVIKGGDLIVQVAQFLFQCRHFGTVFNGNDVIVVVAPKEIECRRLRHGARLAGHSHVAVVQETTQWRR